MFRYALKSAVCEPTQAVNVGEAWEGDYLGASRAALNALWLNRERPPAPSPCKEIHDLRGILPFLSLDETE